MAFLNRLKLAKLKAIQLAKAITPQQLLDRFPKEGTPIECPECRAAWLERGIWVVWAKAPKSRPTDLGVCVNCGTIVGFELTSGRSWRIAEPAVGPIMTSAVGEVITELQRQARLDRWIVPTEQTSGGVVYGK